MNKFIKKAVSGFLSIAIAGGCFAAGSFASSALSVKYGDVDNNGTVNSTDALNVLLYTVASQSLDAAAIKRADVNADGKVTSADALDILRYVVGDINSFKAESAVPTDKSEILALYASALDKAKTDKPKYTVNVNSQSTDVSADFSGTLFALMSSTDIEDLRKELVDDLTTSANNTDTFLKGSSESEKALPATCKLTDGSVLKSATCQKDADGNYVIEINFKDETNPKISSSPLVKALNVPDYDSMLAELKAAAAVDGVTIDVTALSLNYSGCYIKCTINPETNTFVSLQTYAKTTVSSSMTMTMLLSGTVKTAFTTTDNSKYSGFSY